MTKENTAKIVTDLPKKNILAITKIKMKMYKNYRRGDSSFVFNCKQRTSSMKFNEALR